MAIESSVIPLPSELVVPPAAYMAAANGEMNIFLIIMCATVGACIGASVNYVVALYVGRPVVYAFANSRIGHLCLVNQQKVEHAEQYFDNHGAIGTFIGRLVPAVRHLISIPAGLARMRFSKFLFYTALGAGIWNCILAAIGWYLASVVPYDELGAQVEQYSHELKYVMIALGVGVVAYLVYKACRK